MSKLNRRKFCKCGICGLVVKPGNSYIWGHNTKGKLRPEDEILKIKETCNTVKYKNEMSQNQKITHNTPQFKQTMSLAATITNSRPGQKERNSQSQKKNWQNPIYREKTLLAIGKGLNIKPNKPEQFWTSILPERYPELGWEYTGDFTFWINGKNPDFISKKYKLVIEYNGGYYHQDDIPGQREAIFAQWGWKTFIIKDIEMLDMDKLYQRLDEFCLNIITS